MPTVFSDTLELGLSYGGGSYVAAVHASSYLHWIP